MTQKKRDTKGGKNSRRKAKYTSAVGRRKSGRRKSGRRKSGRRKSLSLSASIESPKPSPVSMREVLEFYKPIKKAVTLRLDADVLAWFRRDGRHYQTRINAALRRVMEREIKAGK